MFLGSGHLGALPAWLAGLSVQTRRAVLVPTAAKPMPQAPFVAAADATLRAQGFEVLRLELDEVGPDEVESALCDARVVFVTGGYALFLLQHVRRTRMSAVVTDLVRAGQLAYVGISAGAALAGPDLAPLRDPDDPGKVDSTEALGLVPFVVLAHRNRGRHDHHQRISAAFADRFRCVSLADDEAVLVEGDDWRVCRSEQEPS